MAEEVLDAPETVTGERKEEATIRQWVEANLGPVKRLERVGRWRPCWYVDVLMDGEVKPLYVRGDRPGDWPPMGLAYECGVFKQFEANGVRVPHVYGFIEEIPGIVMDNVPGAPDLSRAESEEIRESLRRQLMEQMLLIHRSDVDAMEAIGSPRPAEDKEAALSYYRLIENLFTGNRVAPAPGIEFVRRWLNNNVPENPDGVCPVTVDAAQFIFEGDRLTAMLDFEFAGIGDFHTDLAALRIRNRAEYIGDVDELVAYYAKLSGRDLDYHRIRYHTAVIGVLTPMQVANELAKGPAGIDYHEYVVWTAFCMLISLDCIAEMRGWERVEFSPPEGIVPSRQSKSLEVLAAKLLDEGGADEFSRYQSRKNARVVRYAERASRYQPLFDRDYLDDAEALLGVRPANWVEADRLLEERVVRDDPDDEQALHSLFTRLYLRECFLLADPEDVINYEQITTRMKPLVKIGEPSETVTA